MESKSSSSSSSSSSPDPEVIKQQKRRIVYSDMKLLHKKKNTVESNIINYNGILVERFDAQKANVAGLAQSPTPFVDPQGDLPLSDSIKEHSGKLERPSVVFGANRVKMGSLEDFQPGDIKQSSVGDCSFVSCLIIMRYWEKITKKNYISQLLYPQIVPGVPTISPTGLYYLRLNIYGSEFMVRLDDRLPYGNYNLPLYSRNQSKDQNTFDLFIPLVEKGFVKLHGGYAIDGSNSFYDMWILKKWIPDYYKIKGSNLDSIWTLMRELYNAKSAIMTCSVSNSEASGSELVQSNHAYAVLEVVEYKGLRVLLIQNPWNSEGISVSKALAFDGMPSELKELIQKNQNVKKKTKCN